MPMTKYTSELCTMLVTFVYMGYNQRRRERTEENRPPPNNNESKYFKLSHITSVPQSLTWIINELIAWNIYISLMSLFSHITTSICN